VLHLAVEGRFLEYTDDKEGGREGDRDGRREVRTCEADKAVGC
jgi:hypothetical protein